MDSVAQDYQEPQDTGEIPIAAHETASIPPAGQEPSNTTTQQNKPLTVTTVLFTHLEHLQEEIAASTHAVNHLHLSVGSTLTRMEQRELDLAHWLKIAWCFLGAFLLITAFLLGALVAR